MINSSVWHSRGHVVGPTHSHYAKTWEEVAEPCHFWLEHSTRPASHRSESCVSAQLERIPSSPVVQVAVHDFRRDPRHFHVTTTFPRCRRLSLYTRAVLGRQTLLILVVVNKPCLSCAPVSSHLLQSILFHHPSLFDTQCPTSCSSTTATLSFGTRGNGTRIIPELRRP